MDVKMAKINVLEKLEQKYDKHASLAGQTKKILDNVELLRNLNDSENRIMARYSSPIEYYNWGENDLPKCDIVDKIREISVFNQTNGNMDAINYQIGLVKKRIRDRKISEKDYQFLMNNTPKYLVGNCSDNIYKKIEEGTYLRGEMEDCLFFNFSSQHSKPHQSIHKL